jgi:hypothetical protein
MIPEPMNPDTTQSEMSCTAETREHIDSIRKWQRARELSDAAFCKRLPISQSTWSRIYNNKYLGDADGQIATLVPAWRRLVEETKLEAATPTVTRTIFEFACFTAAKKSIGRAMALATQSSQDKLVWYVADTGWGKDTLSEMVRKDYGGTQILCRKSWRASYYAMLLDMGAQLGIEEKKLGQGAHAAESSLLAFLKANPRTLIFNETEFVGTAGLGLIKSILNETACSVLILCVPDTYSEFLRKGGTDMQQCRRRTIAVVKPGSIAPSEAAKFIIHVWPKLTTDTPAGREVAKALADAANEFGGWAMCWRIVEELHNLHNPAEETPTSSDVTAAFIRLKALNA